MKAKQTKQGGQGAPLVTLGKLFPGHQIYIENRSAEIYHLLKSKSSATWGAGIIKDLPNFYKLAQHSPAAKDCKPVIVVAHIDKVNDLIKLAFDKVFYQQDNIGSAKYTVNFHDGVKTHKDGSQFFDIRIFKNKKKRDQFIKELKAEGYKERGLYVGR